MTHFDYLAPARLYLGGDFTTARSLGGKRFKSAAAALRFALEEAAPVSLRGAILELADADLQGPELRRLYEAVAYPLRRKVELAA